MATHDETVLAPMIKLIEKIWQKRSITSKRERGGKRSHGSSRQGTPIPRQGRSAGGRGQGRKRKKRRGKEEEEKKKRRRRRMRQEEEQKEAAHSYAQIGFD